MKHFDTVWNTRRGERMQEQEQNKNDLAEAEKVEPIAIYQNNIYALVDDVKQQPQFSGQTEEEK